LWNSACREIPSLGAPNAVWTLCSSLLGIPLATERAKLWNMPDRTDRPNSEADLLDLLVKELERRLPATWRFEFVPQPRYGRARPDALLRLLAPDGTLAQIPVEAKTTLNARDVPNVLNQLQTAAEDPEAAAPLVISRYIAPRPRTMLAEAGASYLDATGNLRIAIERPAVFLEASGASADPWRGPERETRTLRGKPAARVVRALVDTSPPLGIRDLSKRSGASLGSTYRTVDFLDKEALIRRGDRGAVIDVSWADLLGRWSEDYSFRDSNQIRQGLEPRGPERVLERLRGSKAPYAITGALSARRVSEVAPPRAAMIFTPDLDGMAKFLDLRDSGGAANVLLARPFDDVVFERGTEENEIRYSAFSQTAVDLLAGSGRDPAQGEALINWMAANEGDWRG
jgi:hypothetical protein